MKKINLSELKQCFFVGSSIGNDDDVFHDGAENNRMWCAMIEALEEARAAIDLYRNGGDMIDSSSYIDMMDSFLERFEDD